VSCVGGGPPSLVNDRTLAGDHGPGRPTAVLSLPGLKPADWTPRELRHSFVSLLSDPGVPRGDIAQLVGHSGTTVTELVYGTRSGPSSRPAQRSWIGSSDTAAQVRSHSVGHSPGRRGWSGRPESVSDLVGDTGFEPVTLILAATLGFEREIGS
jgi:hypothetical protein